MSKTWIEGRLDELRAEQEAGTKMLGELRSRQATLEQTLLRIDGAIQVLEEQLRSQREDDPEAKGSA